MVFMSGLAPGVQGFIYCYTLEANYNTMMITNRMTNIDLGRSTLVIEADLTLCVLLCY